MSEIIKILCNNIISSVRLINFKFDLCKWKFSMLFFLKFFNLIPPTLLLDLSILFLTNEIAGIYLRRPDTNEIPKEIQQCIFVHKDVGAYIRSCQTFDLEDVPIPVFLFFFWWMEDRDGMVQSSQPGRTKPPGCVYGMHPGFVRNPSLCATLEGCGSEPRAQRVCG